MAKKFLTAEWRKLAMANYAVDPAVLRNYLPAHTELDLWNGRCYISLVGFMFLNTRILGVKIPFHVNFEEVNLRFYVRHLHDGAWRRGVVFITEIVPKPAVTMMANTLYHENYVTLPMRHDFVNNGDGLRVEYQWKKGTWNSFTIKTGAVPVDIALGSEEEFITEHYWGYTRINDDETSAYGVEHPVWQVYPTVDYAIEVDFGRVYGSTFEFMKKQKPQSVFLAEGFEIIVRPGQTLKRRT